MPTVDVDPAIRSLLDTLAAAGEISVREIGPEQARALYKSVAFAGEAPVIADVSDRTIPGPAGDILVRVYRPVDAVGTLVWYHGGGWVIGDLDTADSVASTLAVEAGCVVLSVGYRLAPEHAHPAAFDDAWAALRWAAANAAELGGDPECLAVGGDSAGGHLAALVALRARDEGLALRHQLLVYPVTSLGATSGSRTTNGTGYFLTQDAMAWFEECYLQGQDPSSGISPLGADVTGVAPAHVITAGFDPLRDEGQAYAAALAAAGVPVFDDRYPTMIHGFLQMGSFTPVTEKAIGRAAAFLAAALK